MREDIPYIFTPQGKLQPAERKKGLLCVASSPCLDIKDEHRISVDVCARKVVGCKVYELVEPPREDITSRFVHAWPLPSALCSAARQRHATMR